MNRIWDEYMSRFKRWLEYGMNETIFNKKKVSNFLWLKKHIVVIYGEKVIKSIKLKIKKLHISIILNKVREYKSLV